MSKIFSKYCFLLVLIIVMSFALPRLIPGSPLSYSENDTYILNQTLPEESFNYFKEYYAPEKPMIEQFGLYISNLAKMDLGYSFYCHIYVS